MNDTVEILEGEGNWRRHTVRYMSGRWEVLKREIPLFRIEDFKVEPDGPSNPFLKTVVRVPRNDFERSVPVGTVSPSYSLAQHAEVVERCLDGIRQSELDPSDWKCEIGLTELGEWMNFCIYFPEEFSHVPKGDKNELGLRLECFNSVNGSSRLTIFFGWLRFVCSNGLIIGETKAEIKDTHDKNLDLEQIPPIIQRGMELVDADLKRLRRWDETPINRMALAAWVNTRVANEWGKKAAARVFHICDRGCEVRFLDPFAPGEATEKPVEDGAAVPGARKPAQSIYDISQALSWVATNRRNPEERVAWQSQIPKLLTTFTARART